MKSAKNLNSLKGVVKELTKEQTEKIKGGCPPAGRDVSRNPGGK